MNNDNNKLQKMIIVLLCIWKLCIWKGHPGEQRFEVRPWKPDKKMIAKAN